MLSKRLIFMHGLDKINTKSSWRKEHDQHFLSLISTILSPIIVASPKDSCSPRFYVNHSSLALLFGHIEVRHTNDHLLLPDFAFYINILNMFDLPFSLNIMVQNFLNVF